VKKARKKSWRRKVVKMHVWSEFIAQAGVFISYV
jgi:hypothetical protein